MSDRPEQSPFIPESRLRRRLLYLLLFPLLGLMLLFPQTAATGAMNGLTLWSQTLLPVLLPFLILSGLLITLKMTRPLNLLLSPLLCRLFPVSRAACYPLLLGLLCGMPLGAKTTAELYRSGEISERDARFLLGFSNQASLMFIISYVAAKELAAPAYTALYLSIIYLTGWIISACFFRLPIFLHGGRPDMPGAARKTAGTAPKPARAAQSAAGAVPRPAYAAQSTADTVSSRGPAAQSMAKAPGAPAVPSLFTALDGCIIDGFATITKIGGYVILFSMLSAFVARLPLPQTVSAVLCGALEITSGIHKICAAGLTAVQKTALTIGITAFGGFSGILQTKSVTLGSGLSIRYYVIVKLTQGICAGLLAFAVSAWLTG